MQNQLATKHSIAATEVRLRDGHNGTKENSDHSLPSMASFTMPRSRAEILGFPSHSVTNVVRDLELRVASVFFAPPRWVLGLVRWKGPLFSLMKLQEIVVIMRCVKLIFWEAVCVHQGWRIWIRADNRDDLWIRNFIYIWFRIRLARP